MKKATTKDELFLLKLYEMALKAGDEKTPFDRLSVGRAIGQNDRGTYVITRDLAQANFVKKAGEDAVCLTDHGLRLVAQLKQQGL
jgi:hypothetical protein